jgi:ABC-type dipeptide/oligopeptide/nickel transport system permease subunit
LLRHLLPNIMGPVIVMVSAGLAGVAGSEILLSFLGIGIQPPVPSLGLMIYNNGSISVLRSDPHLLLFPVGTLAVLLFTFNLLGDAVNDAFNPRAR